MSHVWLNLRISVIIKIDLKIEKFIFTVLNIIRIIKCFKFYVSLIFIARCHEKYFVKLTEKKKLNFTRSGGGIGFFGYLYKIFPKL